MTNILIAFPKLEEGRGIKNILIRNGFSVSGVCTSGMQAAGRADEWNEGIIICGYKLTDMMYSGLQELLPTGFEMLLLAPGSRLNDCLGNDIVCLGMPLKVKELVDTVDMMVEDMERRRRARRKTPVVRDEKQTALITEAKELLMERNNMTEAEAHRYMQKSSMDSGTNMVETAQMILALMSVS